MVLFFKTKKAAAKPANAKVMSPKKTVRWANKAGGSLGNTRLIDKTGKGIKLGELVRTGSKYMSAKDRAKLSNKRTAEALYRASVGVSRAKTEADKAALNLKLAKKKTAAARKSGTASPFSSKTVYDLENAATDANIRLELAKMKSKSTRALLL
jgi:hypothetical protein